MPAETLTQARLKEILNYDPLTGGFVWRVRRSQMLAGSVAGCVSNDGYSRIAICYKKYLAHRLAWLYITGRFPADQTDHIDHNRANNIFANLREATNLENGKNASIPADNTSDICGVDWHKPGKKWRAKIMIYGKSIHLGLFESKMMAKVARKVAEEKYGFHPNHGVPKP